MKDEINTSTRGGTSRANALHPGASGVGTDDTAKPTGGMAGQNGHSQFSPASHHDPRDGEIIIRNFDKLEADRATLNSIVEECKAYATPGKYGSRFDRRSDSNTQRSLRERPKKILIDHLAAACFIFSHGMSSNLCPPSVQWFGFGLPDKMKDRWPGLGDYVKRAASTIYELLYSTSNFSTEVNEAIEDAGTCGTILMSVEPDPARVFRFKNHDFHSFYLEESRLGVKDTVYRIVPMTALQIVNEFSQEQDEVPEEIRRNAAELDSTKSGKVYEMIHYVAPNRSREYGEDGNPTPGKRNKRFTSIWVERRTRQVIRRGGYDYMPYVTACIDNPCNGIYSDSPMQRSLRTARTMNRAWKSYADATEAAVRPSVAVDLSAYANVLPEFFFDPGSVNVYDSGGGKFNPPNFYVPPANLPLGKDFIAVLQQQIDTFWFTGLFNAISNLNEMSGRQRTAYEIQQIVIEKNNMILPVTARFIDEFFSPLLKTCFFIALESGALGMPPTGIDDSDFNLTLNFNSPLALAAQKNKVNGTLSAMSSIAELAQLNPQFAQGMDVFKADAIIRDIAESYGAHPDHLASEAEVRRIREVRAQQLAAQQEQAAALEMMKGTDLTAPVADNSLAGQLSQGISNIGA